MVEGLESTSVAPRVLGRVEALILHVGAEAVNEGESAVEVVVPGDRAGSSNGGSNGGRARVKERLCDRARDRSVRMGSSS